MSWQARRWADAQNPRSAMCKYVLLAYAHFANNRGESWPGMGELVSYTLANEKTIRGATKLLLADELMVDTGKTRGTTGKIPVYKLPLNSTTNPPKNGGINPASNPPTNPASNPPTNPPKNGGIVIGESVPIPEPGTRNPVVVTSPNVMPHNEKSTPPKTTTTTIWEVLLAELKQQYPEHNIGYEFERCRAHYAKIGKKVTATHFRKWMARAELPLVRPKPERKALPPPPEPPPLTPEERAAGEKFLKEMKSKSQRGNNL